MKKMIIFFLLFFSIIYIFGQSNESDVDKMLKATFIFGGETLGERFNDFRDAHCQISYDLGLSQPEDPDWRHLNVTVENDKGVAIFGFSINMVNMLTQLDLLLFNYHIILFDFRFGLPVASTLNHFTDFAYWYESTLSD
jgi:hypothetical protein